MSFVVPGIEAALCDHDASRMSCECSCECDEKKPPPNDVCQIKISWSHLPYDPLLALALPVYPCHMWINVKPCDSEKVKRYDVWQSSADVKAAGKKALGDHLAEDLFGPEESLPKRWPFLPQSLTKTICVHEEPCYEEVQPEPGQASPGRKRKKTCCDELLSSIPKYKHRDKYNAVLGPNSNTFIVEAIGLCGELQKKCEVPFCAWAGFDQGLGFDLPLASDDGGT